MRNRSPKQRTYRLRVDNKYITVYINKIDKDVWNLGAIISKNKRRANDWYKARKNKRARKAHFHAERRGMREMMILFRMVRDASRTIPCGHSIVAYPSSLKNKTMMKYVERLGFTPIQISEGESLWVLIDPRSQEDLQPS
jgi:hypothetical protein